MKYSGDVDTNDEESNSEPENIENSTKLNDDDSSQSSDDSSDFQNHSSQDDSGSNNGSSQSENDNHTEDNNSQSPVTPMDGISGSKDDMMEDQGDSGNQISTGNNVIVRVNVLCTTKRQLLQ